jgi:hypothetical protein
MTNRKESFRNLTGKTCVYAFVILFTSCTLAAGIVRVPSHLIDGPFKFEPLPASAQCTGGGNPSAPFCYPKVSPRVLSQVNLSSLTCLI